MSHRDESMPNQARCKPRGWQARGIWRWRS